MELVKGKGAHFVYCLFFSKYIFFSHLCIISTYSVLNIHTFTYQKTYIYTYFHILFCMFLNSRKAFSVSLNTGALEISTCINLPIQVKLNVNTFFTFSSGASASKPQNRYMNYLMTIIPVKIISLFLLSFSLFSPLQMWRKCQICGSMKWKI